MREGINKIWEYVSLLGVSDYSESTYMRRVVLSNRINFVLIVGMALLSLYLFVFRAIYGTEMTTGSIRLLLLMGICIGNLILSHYKYFDLSKALLIIMPPLVIILFPTMVGFIEEEAFFYYGLTIVALSLIPQLLLSSKEQSLSYWGAMLYYFVLFIGIDYVMFFFSPNETVTASLYQDAYMFIISAKVSSFWFINLVLYYIKDINNRFEASLKKINQELVKKNSDLDLHVEDLKSINAQLKDAQLKLVHSEKMATLGVLIAGVTHEINTPLNCVNAGSLLIKNAVDDFVEDPSNYHVCLENVKAGQDIINKGIDRASFIIHSLMTFSYRGEPVKQDFSLNQIVDSTLLFIQQKIDPEIDVVKNYQLDKIVHIYADKIHQIVLNLIDNALYEVRCYNKGTKRIIISTFAKTFGKETMAVLSVFNTGRKISGDVGERIFEPFYTTKGPVDGTGLGLSTSYNLAHEHGGDLYYSNRKDGVEFFLEIPC